MSVDQPRMKPANPSGKVLRNETSRTYTRTTVRTAIRSLATTVRSSVSEPEKDRDHDGVVSWCMNQLSALSLVNCLPIQSDTHWFPKAATSTAAVTVPVNERDRVMVDTLRPRRCARYHPSVQHHRAPTPAGCPAAPARSCDVNVPGHRGTMWTYVRNGFNVHVRASWQGCARTCTWWEVRDETFEH